MPGISRLTAVGLLGGLLYLGAAPNVAAQRPLLPITSPLALAGPTAAAFAGPDSTPAGIGTIAGTVRSDEGEPVEGVVVTAVGATTTFTVTDERGVYELSGLTPGPYMLRAHSSGYLTPRPRTIEVRPNSRTLSSFGLRKAETTPTILAAGIGPVTMATPEPRQPTPDAPETAAADEASGESIPDDHSETAWRLRHVRRGVLRDVSLPGDLRPAEDDDLAAMAEHLGRA
ncbi:MAG: carboxypeptidase-like regulatory domain-containing protein [Vicinamibacterales bacterium]